MAVEIDFNSLGFVVQSGSLRLNGQYHHASSVLVSLLVTRSRRVMRSVPTRDSVGSTILIRFRDGIDDPTLPRDGTDDLMTPAARVTASGNGPTHLDQRKNLSRTLISNTAETTKT
jgi:hypothetical protein